MINAMKRKMGLFKSYRRVCKLWEDYSASDNDDETVMDEFLDAFLETYTSFVLTEGDIVELELSTESSQDHFLQSPSLNNTTGLRESSLELDKTFGDLTLVLHGLLKYIERLVTVRRRSDASLSFDPGEDRSFTGESVTVTTPPTSPPNGLQDSSTVPSKDELVLKALTVLSILVRDNKYTTVVSVTRNGRMVRRIVYLLDRVKSIEGKKMVLQTISRLGENSDCQREIGAADGFRKILGLLVEGNEELTKEILKTFRHFLENSGSSGDLSTFSLQSAASKDIQAAIGDYSISPLSDSNSDLDSPPAVPTPKMSLRNLVRLPGVVSEIGKLAILEVFASPREVDDTTFSSVEEKVTMIMKQYSADTGCKSHSWGFPIQQAVAFEAIKMFSRQLWAKDKLITTEDEGFPLNEEDQIVRHSSDFLKNSMRMQGALRMLTESLGSASWDVQMDFLETISKLMMQNEENQKEFLRIGGYDLLTKVLDTFLRTSDFEVGNAQKQFLEQFCALAMILILDWNVSGIVGNLAALRWFVGMIPIVCENHHPSLLIHMLLALEDLISINSLNAIHIHYVSGVDSVFAVVESDIQGLSDIENEEYLAAIDLADEVLKYMATALTYVNNTVAEKYFDSFSRSPSGTLKPIVVRSLNDLCRHYHNAGVVFSEAIGISFICVEILTECVRNSEVMLEILELFGFTSMLSFNENTYSHSRLALHALKNLLLSKTLPREVTCMTLEMFSRCIAQTSCLDTIISPEDTAMQNPIDQHAILDNPCEYLISLLQSLSSESELLQLALIQVARFIRDSKRRKIVLTRFREAGGISYLIDMVKTSSEDDVVRLSFIALSVAIKDSLDNKLCVGSQVGFLEFGQIILNRFSVLKCSNFLFNMIFELATVGDGVGFFTLPGNSLDMIMERTQYIEQAIERLDDGDYQLYQQLFRIRNRYLAYFVLSASIGSMNDAGAQNSITGASSGSLPIFDNLGDDNMPSASIHESMTIFEDNEEVEFEEDTESENTVMMLSSVRRSAAEPRLSAIRFHDTKAALMVLLLIPSATLDIQRRAISHLLLLLACNPTNIRSLCDMHVLTLLLRLCLTLHESLLDVYFELITTIGLYDTTSLEAGLLFRLGMLEYDSQEEISESRFWDIRTRTLQVIQRLATRNAPLYFMNLDGKHEGHLLPAITRFPGPKVGYSISCWFRISNFVNENAEILSLGVSEDTLLQVSIRPNSEKYTLCFEDEDRYVCEESGASNWEEWRHLVIVQCQPYVFIFSNGKLIDQVMHSSWAYIATKNRPVWLKLGGNDPNKYFAGQLGNAHLLEGMLAKKQVTSLFHAGCDLEYAGFKSIGIELKKLSSVEMKELSSTETDRLGNLRVATVSFDDEVYTTLGSFTLSADELVNSSSPSEKLMVSPRFFSRLRLSVDEATEIHHAQEVHVNEIHRTRSFGNELKYIGGTFIFLDMLSGETRLQEAGLGILTSLLNRFDSNLSEFSSGSGFEMLSFILQGNISLGAMRVLLDATVSCSKFVDCPPQTRLRFLVLVLDLLKESSADIRRLTVKKLSEMVVEDSEIAESWRVGAGIIGIIRFLRIGCDLDMQSDALQSVAQIIEHVLSVGNPTNLNTLLSFLVTEKSQFVAEKETICDVLAKSICRSSVILSELRNIDAIPLLFELMESPSENIRVNAMRVIGFILNDNALTKKNFLTRMCGFDLIFQRLVKFPLARSTCLSLMRLAVDDFVPRIETMSMTYSSKSISEAEESGEDVPTIGCPDGIKVLMSLLSTCEDHRLHIQVFDQLDVLMKDPTNCETLLQTDFLVWAQNYIGCLDSEDFAFIHDVDEKLKARVLRKFLLLLQRMMLLDMSLPCKTCKLWKLKEMTEVSDFQALVIESVLLYFEQRPVVEEVDSTNMLRNLVLLYEHAEDIVGLTPDVCVRIINSVNLMASQNSDVVRTRMKEFGMFDIRDNLMLYFIRGEIPHDQLKQAFTHLSFESIAGRTKFRASHGILYILHLFHSSSDPQLSILIAEVLRNQLGEHEENRKSIIKLIQDPMVLRQMLPGLTAEDLLVLNVNSLCFGTLGTKDSELAVHVSSEQKLGQSSVEDFVLWYLSEDRRSLREEIATRLADRITPIEAAAKKSRDKHMQRKVRPHKLRMDKLDKAKQVLDKLLQESNERIHARVSLCYMEYAKARTTCTEQELLRLNTGENALAAKQAEIALLVPNPTDVFYEATEYDLHCVLQPNDRFRDDQWACKECTYTGRTRWEVVCHYTEDHLSS